MTKSQIFTAAWINARKAAARFGGQVRSYFAICLKAAHAAARKPVPMTLAQAAVYAETVEGVYRASIWNERRVYVNFAGFDRARAGDRNLKIFYEPSLGWRAEGAKGVMSAECRANARRFLCALDLDASII